MVAGVIGSTGALGFVISPLFILPIYQWDPKAPFVLGVVLVGAVAGGELHDAVPAKRAGRHRRGRAGRWDGQRLRALAARLTGQCLRRQGMLGLLCAESHSTS